MKQITLVEHVGDWHAQLEIDRPNRVVRNVALTGGTSRNGYCYSQQALEDAVSLYSQRPVFLDHAANKSRPQDRSTRDLVGSIVNPRYEAGRIRGDIRVLDTDSGRTFLALAESDAPGVGMSHVVLAERAATDGQVSRIHDVISVDAVVFPATTTTFRESQTISDHRPLTDNVEPRTDADSDRSTSCEKTGEERSAANGHLAASASQKQGDRARLEQEVQQLLCERNELLAELRFARERQACEQREHAVARLIRDSGLPAFAVTEAFCRLLASIDTSLHHELIQERLAFIDAVRRRPPASCERVANSQPALSDAVFVAALKRRAS